MTFSRIPALRRVLTPVMLAALAGTATIAWQAPAMAQKKEKAAAAAKANYSKEFIAAYKPFEELSKATPPDTAAMKAALPALMTAVKTEDDRLVAGQAYVSVGNAAKDSALQLQGIEMMLQSGKSDPARTGQIALAGGQIAYNAKDYAKARTFLTKAAELGITEGDPQILIAETYFGQNDTAGGLKYLEGAIAARKAAGQPVSELWMKRALSSAYTGKLNAEARKWGMLYAREFPNQTSWGDAIAVAINTEQYQPADMLDILRLARRTGTLRTRAMYLEYVDAADARKLPNEVLTLIDAGIAAKVIDGNVQMVKDARATATSRIAIDKKEVPSLQRDASAPGAKLVTVMAAADTLLSYGQYAEAETLFAKAAVMPGANVPMVLTRQGIAQVEQGKHAEAQATFAKVQGSRASIAALWSLYAAQKASGTTIAPATASATTTS